MKNVIFRPTNSCNLRCTYCYDKNNHNESDIKLREKATEIFLKQEDNILKSLSILFKDEKEPHIIFHGGEPLLIDTKVLDDFCYKLKELFNITFSIQTNGTLIDDKVIELFKKYNFKVGISLDGCNEYQNASRIFPNGLNSFKTILKKMKMLQENNVKFGLIMSITKAHTNGEKELYDFIGDNNFSCNIRPVFSSDPDIKVMSPEEYVNFFMNLFDIWFNDESKKVRTHQILELYQALKNELDPNFYERTCNNSNRCFKDFISLDIFSNLYACNRLYGIDKFYYGNLNSDSIDVINNKIDDLLEERNNSISNSCSNCEIIDKCYGGCPAESYDMYKDILHPTDYCKIKKLTSTNIKKRLII